MEKLFNPFPGLRPFEAHENHLFFGRDGQSDELLTRLRRNRFLAVVGTSGSGKSSLVRAGLLPGLYGGLMAQAGSRWRIGVFRPGSQPIGHLAETLNAPEVFGRNEQVQQTFTETVLRRGSVGLIEVAQEVRMPARDNLLLVVDQFEELFRFKQASPSAGRDDEAAAFVKLLLEATKQQKAPIYVVLTMRSDFLGDCAQFRDLPEAINDGQYLIPRMTRDQRREAITGPIAVGGAKITPRLVNRLLNDVGDNPDQLPILQHALMRTWDYWAQHHKDGEPIDIPHYEAIGGMAKALSRHADEAFYELQTPRRQAIAEKLFKALTEKGEDNREIRRPTLLRDACALAEATETEVAAVVEIFRRSGRTFLMPPSEVKLHAGTLIDISHESLIRNWERLKKWVDEEAQSAQIYRRLAETAVLNKAGQAGLWRDPDLQIALQWQKENRPNEMWAQRYHSEYSNAISFLQKSQVARDAEIAEKETARQRELQQAQALAEEQRKRAEEQARAASKLRRRAMILALVVLIAVIAAVSASVLYKNLKDASKTVAELKQEAEDLTEAAQKAKARADSAKTVADSAVAEAQKKRQEAEYYAGVVARVRYVADSLGQVADRQAFLADSLEHEAQLAAVRVDSSRDEAVKIMAKAEEFRREAERLRRVSTALLLAAQAPLQGNDELALLLAHSAYAINLNNRGGYENEVYAALRNALNRPSFNNAGGPDTLHRHADWGISVAFSPDGQLVASGSADSTVILWNWSKDKLQPLLRGHRASVRAVTFDRKGQLLASGGDDHTVRLWNLARPDSAFRIFLGHHGWVWSVAFSPDGKWLASGSADSTVMLWNLAQNGIPAVILRDHKFSVRTVAFSPDGRLLASGSADGAAHLWELHGGEARLMRTLKHSAGVRTLAFSPESNFLATGSDDKMVRLWDLRNADEQPTSFWIAHDGWVNAVAFSPDGRLLASGSEDGAAKLWDLNEPGKGPMITLPHGQWVWSVAFSPDGDYLATGCSDKTIRVWIARTGILAKRASEKVKRNLTEAEWKKVVGEQIPFDAAQLKPNNNK